MAKLENKGIDPVLAVVANFFVYSILGYILIGQVSKGVKVFVVTLIGSFLCVIPGIIVAVLALLDVYEVALAVKNGEEVDEAEYKNELLYNILKLIDSDAVYKPAGPSTPAS